MRTVKVEIFSDYICPWCYIGKMRLSRLRIALSSDINLEIEVRPYLLYPDMPKGGVPKSVFTNRTKPGMGKSLRAESELENIVINYKLIDMIPNTLEAHRLVWLIKDNEVKYNLSKKIINGYFERGEHIEDRDILKNMARSMHVSDQILKQYIETNIGFEEVEKSIEQASEQMITLVPSIRLDGKYMIPGLQSIEVLEKYIRRAADKQGD